MTFMLTRAQVGNYDEWKAIFDTDPPRARESAKGYRVYRSTENPDEVFIAVEFESRADAEEGRERLVAAGVLDRFEDRTGPTIVELAEAVGS
jgi:heme-degrading monooxygenase HmoA